MNKKINDILTAKEKRDAILRNCQPLIFKPEQAESCIKGKAHQFEPRYSLGGVNGFETEGVPPDLYIKMVQSLRSKTYVYDICVKCGKIIKPES